MKRILNYPGSKWRMADVIVNLLPEHETYLEPFAGSLAVFFTKEPSPIETINDLDSRLINFYKVCRDNPKELIRQLELTPMSRQEHQISDIPNDNPIESARRLVVQSWQSIGGLQRHKTGWRSSISTSGHKIDDWVDVPNRILTVAERLKMAQIENQDALQLLRRYDRKNVLTYVDPPYLMSTRKGRYYQTEFEDERQPELLDILNNFSGKVILSGYDNDLYNRQLADWWKLTFESNAEAGQRRLETLWLNFEPSGQMSLFG